MKRMTSWALAFTVGACLLAPASASAALILGATGGTAGVNYEGTVTYQPLNFSGTGTLVSKNQTSLAFDLTASFAFGDLDFSNTGFRWTETITNNTSDAWTSYSLDLGANGNFFLAAPDAPAFVILSAGPVVTRTALPGTVTLSADKKSIDLAFTSPILVGGSFSVHTPIEGLANVTSFAITETATAAIPAPATLALLGLGLAGLGLSRRKP